MPQVTVDVGVRLQVVQSTLGDLKKVLNNLEINSKPYNSLLKIINDMEKSASNVSARLIEGFSSKAQFGAANKELDKMTMGLTKAAEVLKTINFNDLAGNVKNGGQFKQIEQDLLAAEKALERVKAQAKTDIFSDVGMKDTLIKIDKDAINKSFDEIVQMIPEKLGEITKNLGDLQVGETLAKKIHESLQKGFTNGNWGDIFNGAKFKAGGNAKFIEQLSSQLEISDADLAALKNKSASQLNSIFDHISQSMGADGSAIKLTGLESNLKNAIEKLFQDLNFDAAAGKSLNVESLANFKTQVEDIAKALQQTQETGDVAQGMERYNNTVTTLAASLAKLKAEAATAAGANSNLGSSIKNAQSALNSLRSSLQQVNVEFLRQQALTNTFNSLKMSVMNFMGFHQVLNLVKTGIKDAANHIKELDSIMNGISIVTNMTTADLWAQVDVYSAMAEKYGVAIKGAYEVSQIYYQQGLETNEVLTLTDETLKLCKVSGLDYAQATDYMTTAIRGFKMEMSEASTVVDVYSNLAANTAVSQEELAIAMSKTASSMENVGSSFQETSAMIATMVAVTRESATNIGTAMKSIAARYGEMTKDPLKLVDEDGVAMSYNKVDAALQSIGISMKDANGQFRDFTDVILELTDVWDQLSSVQQRYVATQFAGNRMQSRFLALISNGDLLKQNIKLAENSEDVGTTQALKTLDSIKSKIEQVQVAYQQFYTTIGIEGVWKKALDGMHSFVDGLNTLPKAFDKIPVGAIAILMNGIGLIKTLMLSGLNSIAQIMLSTLRSASDSAANQTGASGSLIGQTWISKIISEINAGKAQVQSAMSNAVSSSSSAALIDKYTNTFNQYMQRQGSGTYVNMDWSKIYTNLANSMHGAGVMSDVMYQKIVSGNISAQQAIEQTINRQNQLNNIMQFGHNIMTTAKGAWVALGQQGSTLSVAVQSTAQALSMFAMMMDKSTEAGRHLSGAMMSISGGLQTTLGIARIAAGDFSGIATAAIGIMNIVNGFSIWHEDEGEKLERLNKQAEELSNKAKQAKTNYKTLQTNVEELKELEKTRYDNAEAAEKYQSAVDELASSFPELIAGFDSAGNVIIDTVTAEEQLAAARRATLRATYEAAQADEERTREEAAQKSSKLFKSIGKGKYTQNDNLLDALASDPNLFMGAGHLSDSIYSSEDGSDYEKALNWIKEAITTTAGSLEDIKLHYDLKEEDILPKGYQSLGAIFEAPGEELSDLINQILINWEKAGGNSEDLLYKQLQAAKDVNDAIQQGKETYTTDDNSEIPKLIQEIQTHDENWLQSDEGAQTAKNLVNQWKQLEESQQAMWNQIFDADLSTMITELDAAVAAHKGSQKQEVSSYLQYIKSMEKDWNFLEDNTQAQLLLTDSLVKTWENTPDLDWEHFKKSAVFDETLDDFYKGYIEGLSKDQKEILESMGADTRSFSAEDIIDALSSEGELDKSIEQMILDRYRTAREGMEEFSKSVENKTKNYDQDSIAKEFLDSFKEKTFNLTAEAQDFIMAESNMIHDLEEQGFKQAANELQQSSKGLIDKIEEGTYSDQNTAYDILNEANLNTREGIDAAIEEINNSGMNESFKADLVAILTERRNLVIENFVSSLQAQLSELTEGIADEKKLLSAARSGMDIGQANELINLAREYGVNFNLGENIVFDGKSWKLLFDSEQKLREQMEARNKELQQEAEEAFDIAKDVGVLTEKGDIDQKSIDLLKFVKEQGYNKEVFVAGNEKLAEFLSNQGILDSLFDDNGQLLENWEQIYKDRIQGIINLKQQTDDTINQRMTELFGESKWERGEYGELSKEIEANLGNRAINKDKSPALAAAVENTQEGIETLMSDLVSKGIEEFNIQDYVTSGIDSNVFSQIVVDISRVSNGLMSYEEFVTKWGQAIGQGANELESNIDNAHEKDFSEKDILTPMEELINNTTVSNDAMQEFTKAWGLGVEETAWTAELFDYTLNEYTGEWEQGARSLELLRNTLNNLKSRGNYDSKKINNLERMIDETDISELDAAVQDVLEAPTKVTTSMIQALADAGLGDYNDLIASGAFKDNGNNTYTLVWDKLKEIIDESGQNLNDYTQEQLNAYVETIGASIKTAASYVTKGTENRSDFQTIADTLGQSIEDISEWDSDSNTFKLTVTAYKDYKSKLIEMLKNAETDDEQYAAYLEQAKETLRDAVDLDSFSKNQGSVRAQDKLKKQLQDYYEAQNYNAESAARTTEWMYNQLTSGDTATRVETFLRWKPEATAEDIQNFLQGKANELNASLEIIDSAIQNETNLIGTVVEEGSALATALTQAGFDIDYTSGMGIVTTSGNLVAAHNNLIWSLYQEDQNAYQAYIKQESAMQRVADNAYTGAMKEMEGAEGINKESSARRAASMALARTRNGNVSTKDEVEAYEEWISQISDLASRTDIASYEDLKFTDQDLNNLGVGREALQQAIQKYIAGDKTAIVKLLQGAGKLTDNALADALEAQLSASDLGLDNIESIENIASSIKNESKRTEVQGAIAAAKIELQFKTKQAVEGVDDLAHVTAEQVQALADSIDGADFDTVKSELGITNFGEDGEAITAEAWRNFIEKHKLSMENIGEVVDTYTSALNTAISYFSEGTTDQTDMEDFTEIFKQMTQQQVEWSDIFKFDSQSKQYLLTPGAISAYMEAYRATLNGLEISQEEIEARIAAATKALTGENLDIGGYLSSDKTTEDTAKLKSGLKNALTVKNGSVYRGLAIKDIGDKGAIASEEAINDWVSNYSEQEAEKLFNAINESTESALTAAKDLGITDPAQLKQIAEARFTKAQQDLEALDSMMIGSYVNETSELGQFLISKDVIIDEHGFITDLGEAINSFDEAYNAYFEKVLSEAQTAAQVFELAKSKNAHDNKLKNVQQAMLSGNVTYDNLLDFYSAQFEAAGKTAEEAKDFLYGNEEKGIEAFNPEDYGLKEIGPGEYKTVDWSAYRAEFLQGVPETSQRYIDAYTDFLQGQLNESEAGIQSSLISMFPDMHNLSIEQVGMLATLLHTTVDALTAQMHANGDGTFDGTSVIMSEVDQGTEEFQKAITEHLESSADAIISDAIALAEGTATDSQKMGLQDNLKNWFKEQNLTDYTARAEESLQLRLGEAGYTDAQYQEDLQNRIEQYAGERAKAVMAVLEQGGKVALEVLQSSGVAEYMSASDIENIYKSNVTKYQNAMKLMSEGLTKGQLVADEGTRAALKAAGGIHFDSNGVIVSIDNLQNAWKQLYQGMKDTNEASVSELNDAYMQMIESNMAKDESASSLLSSASGFDRNALKNLADSLGIEVETFLTETGEVAAALEATVERKGFNNYGVIEGQWDAFIAQLEEILGHKIEKNTKEYLDAQAAFMQSNFDEQPANKIAKMIPDMLHLASDQLGDLAQILGLDDVRDLDIEQNLDGTYNAKAAIEQAIQQVGMTPAIEAALYNYYTSLISSATSELNSFSAGQVVSSDTATILSGISDFATELATQGQITLDNINEYQMACAAVFQQAQAAFADGMTDLTTLNNSFAQKLESNLIDDHAIADVMSKGNDLSPTDLANLFNTLGKDMRDFIDPLTGLAKEGMGLKNIAGGHLAIDSLDEFLSNLGADIDKYSSEYINAYASLLEGKLNQTPEGNAKFLAGMLDSMNKLSADQLAAIAIQFDLTMEQVMAIVHDNGDGTYNAANLLNDLGAKIDKSDEDFVRAFSERKQAIADDLISAATEFINSEIGAGGLRSEQSYTNLENAISDYEQAMLGLGLDASIQMHNFKRALVTGGATAVSALQQIAEEAGQQLSADDVETAYRSEVSNYINAFDNLTAGPGAIIDATTAAIIDQAGGATSALEGAGQAVVQSAANLYEAYKLLLERLKGTGEATLEDINKVAGAMLDNRDREQPAIDALGDAASMTYTRFGEILAQNGIELTEAMVNQLEQANIIKALGGSNMAITDFSAFAELMHWDAGSEEYVSAFKTYNDSMIEMNRQVENSILEEVNSLGEAKGGDWVNLTQLQDTLMDALIPENYIGNVDLKNRQIVDFGEYYETILGTSFTDSDLPNVGITLAGIYEDGTEIVESKLEEYANHLMESAKDIQNKGDDRELSEIIRDLDSAEENLLLDAIDANGQAESEFISILNSRAEELHNRQDIWYGLIRSLQDNGAIFEDGILKLNSDANILGIFNLISDKLQQVGADLTNLDVAGIHDAANNIIKSIVEAINKAVEGGIGETEAVQLQQSLSGLGINTQLDFSATANGLQLSASQAANLYQQLQGVEGIANNISAIKLLDDNIINSMTQVGNGFENISQTTARIAEVERQIAENNADISEAVQSLGPESEKVKILESQNAELREQLSLYQKIQTRQADDPNSYKFMDQSLPDYMQGAENYWNGIGKAFEAMNEAGQTGYMSIQDFRNIVNEMNNMAAMTGSELEFMGQKLDGSAQSASQLIQQGMNYLANIDGKGVKINMNKFGLDISSGAEGMQNGFEEGIKTMAQSQIDMLDAAIQMLEVVVAMEKLGDIDVDDSGDFSIGDIFKLDENGEFIKNKDGLTEYTKEFQDYAQGVLDAAEKNEDLNKALDNFKVSGHSLRSMLEDAKDGVKDIEISEEAYFGALDALVQAAQNGDYDLEHLQESVWDILDKTMPDGETIETGNRTIVFSGGTHVAIDWQKDSVQQATKLFQGSLEEQKQSLTDAITHFEAGKADKIEVVAALTAEGIIKIDEETGKYTIDGEEYDPNSAGVNEAIATAVMKRAGVDNIESHYELNKNGPAKFVTATGTLEVGKTTLKVHTDENGNLRYESNVTGQDYGSVKELIDAEIKHEIDLARHNGAFEGKSKEEIDNIEKEIGANIRYKYNVSAINVEGSTHELKQIIEKPIDEFNDALEQAIEEAKANGHYTSDGQLEIEIEGVKITGYEEDLTTDNVLSQVNQTFDPEALIAKISEGVTNAFSGEGGTSIGEALGQGIIKAFSSEENKKIPLPEITIEPTSVKFDTSTMPTPEPTADTQSTVIEISDLTLKPTGEPKVEGIEGANPQVPSVVADVTDLTMNPTGEPKVEGVEGAKPVIPTVTADVTNLTMTPTGEPKVEGVEGANPVIPAVTANVTTLTLQPTGTPIIQNAEGASPVIPAVTAQVTTLTLKATSAPTINGLDSFPAKVATAKADATTTEVTPGKPVLAAGATLDNIEVASGKAGLTATEITTLGDINYTGEGLEVPVSSGTVTVETMTVEATNVEAGSNLSSLSQLDFSSVATALSNIAKAAGEASRVSFGNFGDLADQLKSALDQANNVWQTVQKFANQTFTVNLVQEGGTTETNNVTNNITNETTNITENQTTNITTNESLNVDTSGAQASTAALGGAASAMGGAATAASGQLSAAQSALSAVGSAATLAKAQVNILKTTIGQAGAAATGAKGKIDQLRQAISQIPNKAAPVVALASAMKNIPSGAASKINDIITSLNKFNNVKIDPGTASLTVSYSLSGPSSAKGNTRSLSKGRNALVRGTHKAMASGSRTTLMGELGPEMVVSNGTYSVVGQNGAEFVDLPDDAIVFNHLQTKKLLTYYETSTRGTPVVSEKKAVSYAKGSKISPVGPAKNKDDGSSEGGEGEGNGSQSSTKTEVKTQKITNVRLSGSPSKHTISFSKAKGTIPSFGPAQASAAAALSALKELRAMWQSLLNASGKDLGSQAGRGGGGGGGGGGCFAAGTLVATMDGYKKIEEIKENDMVLSYNENTGKNEFSKVLQTMIHDVSEKIYTLFIKGEQLVVTGIHRFLINRRNGKKWIHARNLIPGDEVLLADGSLYKISDIITEYKKLRVYNFEVSNNHNYYVGTNSVLAHNKGCFVAGTLVKTLDGYTNIENIHKGDIVLSYNERTHQNEYSEVLQTMEHYIDENVYTLYIGSEILKVTGNHRFFIMHNNVQDWISADMLHIGDYALLSNGELSRIDNIIITHEATLVYNFEVSNNHNYYVGEKEILAHNKGGCFIAGTPVTMEGYFKNIENIEVGDIVLSYNEATGHNEYNKVLQTMIHDVAEAIYSLYIEDEVLEVTGIHRFFINRDNLLQWIHASDLEEGDLVLFADGTWHVISKIEIELRNTLVYNFEVSGNHNYYVGHNQILAHNKGGGGSGDDTEGEEPEPLKVVQLGTVTEQIERWYNLVRQIDKLEQDITYQQALRKKYESDRVANGEKIYNTYQKELGMLGTEIDNQKELASLQKSWYDVKRRELEKSNYGNIFTYDENGLQQYVSNKPGSGKGLDILEHLNERTVEGKYAMDTKQQLAYLEKNGFDLTEFLYNDDGTTVMNPKNIKKLSDIKDEQIKQLLIDEGKKSSDIKPNDINEKRQEIYTQMMENFWGNLQGWQDELDSLYDSYNETAEGIQENYAKQNEILQKLVDNEIKVEEAIYKAVEARKQAEIDKLKEQKEAIQKASDNFTEGLSDQLSKEKELYNKDKDSQELTKLQRQLDILQRSGGSASKIRSLQDQIDSKMQDEYFSSQEDQINAIKDASSKQIEKLDKQIQLMEDNLKYEKDHGILWKEVRDIMDGTPESMMAKIMAWNPDYMSKSELQQEEDIREILEEIEIYVSDKSSKSQWHNEFEGIKLSSKDEYADANHEDLLGRIQKIYKQNGLDSDAASARRDAAEKSARKAAEEAYTSARQMGKTEEEAQKAAQKAYTGSLKNSLSSAVDSGWKYKKDLTGLGGKDLENAKAYNASSDDTKFETVSSNLQQWAKNERAMGKVKDTFFSGLTSQQQEKFLNIAEEEAERRIAEGESVDQAWKSGLRYAQAALGKKGKNIVRLKDEVLANGTMTTDVDTAINDIKGLVQKKRINLHNKKQVLPAGTAIGKNVIFKKQGEKTDKNGKKTKVDRLVTDKKNKKLIAAGNFTVKEISGLEFDDKGLVTNFSKITFNKFNGEDLRSNLSLTSSEAKKIPANKKTLLDWIIKQLNSNKTYNDAIKNLRNKTTAATFKTGGMADFTGPAWLDGTRSKPEAVLNAKQTQFLKEDLLGKSPNSLMSIISALQDSMTHAYTNSTVNNSDAVVIENISLNIEAGTISNDYSARRAGEMAMQEILNIARKSGANFINRR